MESLDNSQDSVRSELPSSGKDAEHPTANPVESFSTPLNPRGETVKAELVNTDSQPKNLAPSKVKRGPKKLGKRAQCFLELILAGHPTLDAYALAGYRGQKNAAYVLRCQLRDRIEERLLGDGVSREGLKLELKKLLDIPLSERSKMGVSVKERLQVLKFLDKLNENQPEDKPKITPFLVQVNDPKSVTIQEGK